jgi:integrase
MSERTWEGGFIRKNSRGKDVYFIRRSINGKRYSFSTRCHISSAAHEHLKRFEADPGGYDPGGTPTTNQLLIDLELVREFLTWSRDVQENTPKWISYQKNYLSWWSVGLGDKDLRRLSLGSDILPYLEGWKARNHRIAVLKVFYTWLRTVKHLVKAHEDPMLDTLKVPQSAPGESKRSFSLEDYMKVRKHLEGHWRDGADVLAGTGWHATELVRFVATGVAKESTKTRGCILECPQHKGGGIHRTEVSEEVFSAAKRLLRRGSFDYFKFAKNLKKANKKAFKHIKKVANRPNITPGTFRHSVGDMAVDGGASLAAVSTFLGHKDSRTTRRFYAKHSTPAKVPTLL